MSALIRAMARRRGSSCVRHCCAAGGHFRASRAIAARPTRRRNLAARHARCSRHALHEIIDEFGNILAPLGQRRHPMAPPRDGGTGLREARPSSIASVKIARGGPDDPDVDLDLRRAPTRKNACRPERAGSPPALSLRHVRDLVEEKRAAMGLFERAALRARHRRLPRPEQRQLPCLNAKWSPHSGTTRAAPCARRSFMNASARSVPRLIQVRR